ncbi:bifunctional diaminohydroxyphosphoribosylaminopyrimidine deaminase/5-amino-6-(5-phosphoribosylamino)uracil reductase RibD [Xylophilus ampelinus]|nr:bifunctional diaminohydroxyphosphoribosylaminopyrimidine deaminase/5-amino-6-(5-phosphoribosylamino)uracil reductase RibD [Xylophilus ampelinus]
MPAIYNTAPQALVQALSLAAASPWPGSGRARNGCVVVAKNGTVAGTGSTGFMDRSSAEIQALNECLGIAGSALGATAYILVEPESDEVCGALVGAGVKRVVVSLEHPEPSLAGHGIARLRAAGVEVQVGVGAREARQLNLGLISRLKRLRPWVRLKTAISLDGTTALCNGSSQWITAQAARADVHTWRAQACAVITGVGTVHADDPCLDVRLEPSTRQPVLVIVDSRLETPVAATLFGVQNRSVWIYAATADAASRIALERRGATVTLMPDRRGKVDLAAMLQHLASRGINDIHVEAGAKLNGSLVHEALVDEFLVYVAPKLVGEGRPLAAFGPLADLTQATQLAFRSVDLIGEDLRILARVVGTDNF